MTRLFPLYLAHFSLEFYFIFVYLISHGRDMFSRPPSSLPPQAATPRAHASPFPSTAAAPFAITARASLCMVVRESKGATNISSQTLEREVRRPWNLFLFFRFCFLTRIKPDEDSFSSPRRESVFPREPYFRMQRDSNIERDIDGICSRGFEKHCRTEGHETASKRSISFISYICSRPTIEVKCDLKR